MSDAAREIADRARAFVAFLPPDIVRRAGTGDGRLECTYAVLPSDLYRGTRNNVERIADQINLAYQYGIYDGCAVLMRRLIEMLLILAFKDHQIEDEIRDSTGCYVSLSQIASRASESQKLDLTRNGKEYLELVREKGNLSAHNPFHNARQRDLELLQPKFRHLVEELLHKAGIIT